MRWPGVLGVLIWLAAISLVTVIVHAQAALKGPPYDALNYNPLNASPSAVVAPASGSFAGRVSGSFVGRAFQAGQQATGYTGSESCQSCHQSAYDTWRKTLHVQMTKPIAEARVEGDFGFSYGSRGPTPARERFGREDAPSAPAAGAGFHLNANGRSYTMERRDGRYFVSIARQKQPAEKFEVHYTLGARRFQGYLSKLPDGRIYVLPVFWHNEARRWVDWKEITPIPDDPDHDLRQIWNITCVNCHATNLVKNFDPATKSYATTWTEMGVGCEACHGPGAAHIAIATEWQKTPASKPAEPTAAQLRIFAASKATPREMFDACGYCHGNKNNVFFGFKPGDRYEDYALPFLISQPIPDNDPQGDFWPDGRPSRFNRPQALTLTGCFQSGQATCTSCHRMHGSANDHALKIQVEADGGGLTRLSDRLCTQCHEVAASHSRHDAASQGSRCIACHMSDVNWRLITRRRDHTFQPPVPELTARYGVPNACTTCHEDKSPEWAASTMDAWYGNAEKRRAVVRLSDTMYRAGTGDTAVLPDLARLAADRSHGTLIRASAAEFAGQLLSKDATAARAENTEKNKGSAVSAFSAVDFRTTINALIGAAADREPAVRVTAVRALSQISPDKDPRVTSVLAAHLTDSSRLVRVSAAEALTALGIVRLDGARGEALSRAQDEWAESLRTFNDVAADHTALGWLEASRGHAADGIKELQVAISLDPADARPHVYLGILAARAGDYAQALQHFRTAKKLSPAYQNLDRLIDEAARRSPKGP
jgi:predicted CXXCH cytochrome family protein